MQIISTDCCGIAICNSEQGIVCFREGFNDEGLLDSHLPGLSTLLIQLPNTRERWNAERRSIEAISRDLDDANVFMTLNMNPRSDVSVRRLIHQLEFGTEMPRDYPFEMNTAKFTDLMSKYAAHINIFLYRKVEIFLNAFLRDICGIKEDARNTDWAATDRSQNGWYWRRVEFTETRGNSTIR